jgi:hypothetical protein
LSVRNRTKLQICLPQLAVKPRGRARRLFFVGRNFSQDWRLDHFFLFFRLLSSPRVPRSLSLSFFAAIVLALVVLAAIGLIRDHKWLDLAGDISGLVGAITAAVSIATGEHDVGQRTIYQPVHR